jgi:hypothetical protein
VNAEPPSERTDHHPTRQYCPLYTASPCGPIVIGRAGSVHLGYLTGNHRGPTRHHFVTVVAVTPSAFGHDYVSRAIRLGANNSTSTTAPTAHHPRRIHRRRRAPGFAANVRGSARSNPRPHSGHLPPAPPAPAATPPSG